MGDGQMSEWQAIETAPRDGTRLLLWCVSATPDEGPPEEDICAVGYWDADERFWDRETRSHVTGRWIGKPDTYYAIYLTPTHWMPLPRPPKVAP